MVVEKWHHPGIDLVQVGFYSTGTRKIKDWPKGGATASVQPKQDESVI